MKSPFPTKKVSRTELRHIFNNGGFEERLRSGELHAIVEVESHPSPPKSTQPLCTLSQILAYLDAENQKIAMVHRFKRPGSSTGGSETTRPDPKRVLIDGILYYI
jgi:hypothetical protein